MNKKLNFFEKIWCGQIHIVSLFLLWKEIVFETNGSQSEVFFNDIQSDDIEEWVDMSDRKCVLISGDYGDYY